MDMEKIVSLCKRKGFIFQASEIYGGINGFWDYGPLGVELKRNIKEAWWQDMVRNPPPGPDGQEIRMVGLDCSIIMNPKVWEASGHVGGFNDPMVDCKDTKGRYRYDHVQVFVPASGDPGDKPVFAYVSDQPSEAKQQKKAEKTFGAIKSVLLSSIPQPWTRVIGPDADKPGTLTEPRMPPDADRLILSWHAHVYFGAASRDAAAKASTASSPVSPPSSAPGSCSAASPTAQRSSSRTFLRFPTGTDVVHSLRCCSSRLRAP